MAAIYFDLDGTLIDSRQCCVLSMQDTFRNFFDIDLAAETVIDKMGIPIEVTFRDWAGGKIHDDNWTEVVTYFRASYTVLYGGVEDLLKELRTKTANLFIVTSKNSKAAEDNLSKLGILDYFAHVIGSDRVDHYKPHADPVLKARAKITGPIPSLELMIGDSDADIMTGKAAGVKTCGVLWGAHDKARLMASSPDYIAHDMAELRDIVQSWMKAA